MFWRTPESSEAPQEPQREDGEAKRAGPSAPIPASLDRLPFICLLSYAVLLCAILFVVKFPWLQRTFKTTELDDHPRIPKEKFLNSLKAAACFCGVFLKQVWTQHGAAYQRYSFYHRNSKSFAAEQKSVSGGGSVWIAMQWNITRPLKKKHCF